MQQSEPSESAVSKKQRERQIFEAFAVSIGMPELKAARDAEEPDFLFDAGGYQLGIELVDLVADHSEAGGSASRREESEFDRFLTAARNEWQRQGRNAPLCVHLSPTSKLDPGAPGLRSQAVRELLQILNDVADTLPPDQERVVWDDDENEDEASVLGAFVDLVLVRRSSTAVDTEWDALSAAWVQDRIWPGVADLVRQKERKRCNYLTRCDRVWLVLVATRTGRASQVNLRSFDASGLPANGFGRLYLFDHWAGQELLLPQAR